jgi:hypothetical protein
MPPIRAAALTLLFILALTTFAAPPATLPTTSPATNAAPLYLRAATLIKISSPIETGAPDVAGRPPFPPEWTRVAKSAYEANRPALDLARQARSIGSATWPNDPGYAYFFPLRRLANQLRDAALYEYAQGHPAAALEFVRDGLHLADLLKGRPSRDIDRLITGSSLEGIALNHLPLIAAESLLLPDAAPADAPGLRVRDVRELISLLMDQREPEANLTEIFGPPGPTWIDEAWNPDLATKTLTRANADRTYPALLLACRLFHQDKKRWPVALEELTPAYLPNSPITSRPDTLRSFIQALRTLTRDGL